MDIEGDAFNPDLQNWVQGVCQCFKFRCHVDWEPATASVVALKLMNHMFSPIPPHHRC